MQNCKESIRKRVYIFLFVSHFLLDNNVCYLAQSVHRVAGACRYLQKPRGKFTKISHLSDDTLSSYDIEFVFYFEVLTE